MILSCGARKGIVIAVTLLAGFTHASSIRAVAVLDFEPRGIPATEASMISDRFRTEVVNTGFYTVTERAQVEEILREQGFQQSGCVSTECAIQAGQLIGVTHLITGTVAKTQGLVFMSVRLLDVERGEIVISLDDMESPDLRSAMTAGVKRLVAKLLAGRNTVVAGGDTIVVSSASQLIAALRSNVVISIRPGVYNISAESRSKNANVRWRDNYDGKYPVVRELTNVTIRAASDVITEIVIDPAYGWVMEFEKCSNVSIRGLTFGHTKPGNCMGGVLRFVKCENVQIENCDLYGSGTYGLALDTSSQISVRRTIIRECTYGIMQLRETRNVLFDACRMDRNGDMTMIEVDASENVRFSGGRFSENKGSTMFGVTKDNESVRIERCTFENNQVKKFWSQPGVASMNACEFSGNTFTDQMADGQTEPEKPTPQMEAYLRARYPSSFVDIDNVNADSFGKRCVAYFETNGLSWDRWQLKHFGSTEGYASAFVRTADGGALLVGTRRAKPGVSRVSTPFAIKVDADFNVQWERYFSHPDRGYKAYEGSAGAQCADGGYVVLVSAYYHPSSGAVGWFLRLDPSGKTIRETFLRGTGGAGTPFVRWFRTGEDCAVTIEGRIHPTLADSKAEKEHIWHGRIDSRGKVLLDSVGAQASK